MKKIIPLFIVVLISCKSDKVDIPKAVIQPDKMEAILVDIHVADALAETEAAKGGDEKKLTAAYDELVFKQHGVSKETYLKSYAFYQDNPGLFNEIYDKVLNTLSAQEAELTK